MMEQIRVEDREPVEIIRSEERLDVTTRPVAVRRARLEKFEVTEMRTITVPVVREDVRVVYEPLESGPQEVSDLPAPAEQRPWVLMEDRIIVTTERVPVETVRMVVETVTEQREVTEDVRTEQVTLHTAPLVDAPRGGPAGAVAGMTAGELG